MKRNSMSKILNSTMKKIGFILSFFLSCLSFDGTGVYSLG